MMEDGSLDLSSLREPDFEQLAVYQVRDQPCEEGLSNRAEASLPRNLLLKPSQTLSDVSACPLCARLLRRVVRVERRQPKIKKIDANQNK